MKKNRFDRFLIFPIIALISLCVCIYVNSLPVSEKERESVQVLAKNGSVPKSYHTFEEYSKDKTEKDGMPDSIDANDTVIAVGTTQTDKTYCGNKNSKIFHKLSCSSLKNTKEENKVYFTTREEYNTKGYKPCSLCKP